MASTHTSARASAPKRRSAAAAGTGDVAASYNAENFQGAARGYQAAGTATRGDTEDGATERMTGSTAPSVQWVCGAAFRW